MTVPKAKLRARLIRLADKDMLRLNHAALVSPGFAAPSKEGAGNEFPAGV